MQAPNFITDNIEWYRRIDDVFDKELKNKSESFVFKNNEPDGEGGNISEGVEKDISM